QHIEVFQQIYRATMPGPEREEYNKFKEVFNENFFEEIDNFDIQKKAPLFQEDKNWKEYLKSECLRLDKELDKIIAQHSYFLNENIINQINKIQSSIFIGIILEKETSYRGWIDTGESQYFCRSLENFYNISNLNILNIKFNFDDKEKYIGVDYIKNLLNFIKLLNDRLPEKQITPDNWLLIESSVIEYGSARINNN
ncbi:MAG: hypothetical protein ACOCRX_05965, partial [Candidatus Woesearchaeota archaeon]